MLPRLVLSKKRWNLTGLLGKPPFDDVGADDDGECSSSDENDDPYCNHCGQECSGDIDWWHCELCGEFLCDDCREMVLRDQNILFGVSCDICGGTMCTACHPGWLMCHGEDCNFEVVRARTHHSQRLRSMFQTQQRTDGSACPLFHQCEDCLEDSVGGHLIRCGKCKAVFCFACVANAGDDRCANCDEPVWSNDDRMRFRLRAKAERTKLVRAGLHPAYACSASEVAADVRACFFATAT